LVDSVELLAPLSAENRSMLADALQVASYDAGEYIIKKGEIGNRFYILSSGEVSVVAADGFELSRLKEGSSFGEQALINDDVRKASIRVKSDHAECFYLNREQFNELLGEYQDIWRWLMLRRIPVLATVSDAQLTELATIMEVQTYAAGSVVYLKGDIGDSLFVIEKGECVIEDGEGRSKKYREGANFGERSLMGSETRALNVTVSKDAPASLLSLRRSKLEAMLGDGLSKVTNMARLECLKHVGLLKALTNDQREALVHYLRPEQYNQGDVIFREGEVGNRFYIVETGNVSIHRRPPRGVDGLPQAHNLKDENLKMVAQGEYFGELALLRGDPRAASATVDRGGAFILSLSREDFTKHMGPLQDILDRQAVSAYGVEPRKASVNGIRGHDAPRELSVKSLAEFKIMAVLGVGAFGKVFLTATRHGGNIYAIKSLSKAQILSAQLQNHVMQERDVMKDCDSPYLVRLVATFQDARMLYMCMETVMGGELFSLLTRMGGAVPEQTAKFYTACVVLAFEYLQAKHYIYRDLKPENLLIDKRGYIKVADFGFAKRLSPGEKSYTLCGTPEYMAPELFRQSGHNKAVDWWALGVLIYEMVVGTPPFYSPQADSTEQMRRILAAKYIFPNNVTPAFKDIVKRLLSVNTVQRLGCMKGGVRDVKQHPWLRTVDWVQMTRRTISAPFVPPIKAGLGARGCSRLRVYVF
jgi:cGMP-dependent protein kinase